MNCPKEVESINRPELLPKTDGFVLPDFHQYDALLINVPVTFQQGPSPDGEEPPIGLGRIASYANVVKHQKVGIFDVHRGRKRDGNKLEVEEVRQVLTDMQSRGLKVVGLNPTSVNVEAAVELANLCDEMQLPYVLGGYFATLSDHEQARQFFPIALAIVKRDGEIAFSEIVERMQKDTEPPTGPRQLYERLELGNIPGVYEPGEIEPDNDYAPKLPLAELPLIRPSDYYVNHLESIEINGVMREEATLYVTDGCPYGCTFCAAPVMKLRDWQHPGMKRFVAEIKLAIEDGADAIHCTDDLLFTTGKQIDELYAELENENLLGKFVWRGMGRANVIDKMTENQLVKLENSGCWQLALGVESGSPRIIKEVISKQLTPKMVLDATKKLTKHNIGTKGFFIFGFPGETLEDMQLSYQLAIDMAKAGATSIAAFEFHPYPGTELYKYILENMPWIIPQLAYLQIDWSSIGHNDDVGIEHARLRAAKTSMWLPPELKIAEVNAGDVQKMVLKTLADFERERLAYQAAKLL